MKKHAKLLAPKFNIVLETLEKSLKTMTLHPGHLLKADILLVLTLIIAAQNAWVKFVKNSVSFLLP